MKGGIFLWATGTKIYVLSLYRDNAHFMTTRHGPTRHFRIGIKLQHLQSVISILC